MIILVCSNFREINKKGVGRERRFYVFLFSGDVSGLELHQGLALLILELGEGSLIHIQTLVDRSDTSDNGTEVVVCDVLFFFVFTCEMWVLEGRNHFVRADEVWNVVFLQIQTLVDDDLDKVLVVHCEGVDGDVAQYVGQVLDLTVIPIITVCES